jgi:hypothetical protein
MTIEEKINIMTEVANRFYQYNVRPIAITGSLLLYRLGIDIEREPGDLDLVITLYNKEHEEDAIRGIDFPSDLKIKCTARIISGNHCFRICLMNHFLASKPPKTITHTIARLAVMTPTMEYRPIAIFELESLKPA